MDTQINGEMDQLDHRTCQAICDAIGERLQQDIPPESAPSPRLKWLVEELHRHDAERAEWRRP